MRRHALWAGADPVPAAAEIPVLEGTRFHVVKPYEFGTDGYRFLHGVALAWHGDRLYVSFGHNRGGENTETEEAHAIGNVVYEHDGDVWTGTELKMNFKEKTGVIPGRFKYYSDPYYLSAEDSVKEKERLLLKNASITCCVDPRLPVDTSRNTRSASVDEFPSPS